MAGNKLAAVGGIAEKLLKNELRSRLIAIIISTLMALGPAAGILATFIVVSGVALGTSATMQSLPVNCKAPVNIFDVWDTFDKFVTGVDCNACPTPPAAGAGGGTETDANKAAYVQTIIGTGNAMNVPEKGIIIALITAMQESGLKNYANDGEYTRQSDFTLGSAGEAAGILAFARRSMSFPHDAVGTDHTSVGLFQQQAWWGAVGASTWEKDPEGTMKRLMDPAFGAQKFYNSLLKVNKWESLEYGVAAQRVQASAFPDAYSKHVSEAQALYAQNKSSAKTVTLYDFGAKFTGGTGGADTPATGATCGSSGSGSTTTGVPLQKSAIYMISSQFYAPRGITHNGMDITCRQYEDVYSPISGVVTVAINGNASGVGEPAGRVHIKSEDGSVFWLWHMRNTFVKPGDTVVGGQPVGECASTGNSSGNHLHISANVEGSTNEQLKALPAPTSDLPGRIVDPALALDILGVNICPPYVENRKTAAVGSTLPVTPPSIYMVCWPQTEWK
jgi:murein DD-endopeptidase MepM/ murein hydrolase activator NlpD